MKYLVLFLLLCSTHLFAEKMITQYDMNMSAAKSYLSSEKELTQVYNQLLKKYKSNKLFTKHLIESQKKWRLYLEAQINLVFRSVNESSGTVYSMCLSSGYEDYIKSRIKELKLLDDPDDEGDVCKFYY